MKILIISDSHGAIRNIRHVLGFAKKIKAGIIIHAGDWDSLESAQEVVSSGIPLISVLGNADVDPQISELLKESAQEFEENFLILEIDGKKIGITHKPGDNGKHFSLENLDMVINGHKHSKFDLKIENTRYVRPGPLVTGINFAVFDTKADKLEFIYEKD